MGYDKRKPIVELDKPGGKVIKYWASSKQASDFYKINQVNISYNVNGITKQSKGHYFRFASPKEIAAYSIIQDKIEESESAEPAPIAENTMPSILPVEIIPETHIDPNNQVDTISPFDRLLQESKKKFNKNSL